MMKYAYGECCDLLLTVGACNAGVGAPAGLPTLSRRWWVPTTGAASPLDIKFNTYGSCERVTPRTLRTPAIENDIIAAVEREM
jgi:hypothetical protein